MENLKELERKYEELKKTEKELGEEIERIKQVQKSELKEKKIKLNDIVEFSGFEWYVIDIKDDDVTLFMKDKFTPENMRNYFTNELLDSDCDIQFSKAGNNWWGDSQIRMTLNDFFLDEIDPAKRKLNVMKTTVTIQGKERTCEDYVRLLTKEEADKLPREILKCSGDYGYWLLSPFSGNAYHVLIARTVGYVDDYNTRNSYGVRPAISLKSDILVATESQNNSESEGLVNTWVVKDE